MVDDDLEVIRGLVGEAPVATLGAGLDHRAYAVGNRLVARFGPRVAEEAAVLEAIAPALPLPVPRPVALDVAAGCAIQTRLSGVSALTLPSPVRGRFGPAMVDFAEAVHGLKVAAAVDEEPPSAWLEQARAAWPTVRVAVPPAEHAWIEAFLAAPAPPVGERRFVHGDLGAEHVLVDGDRITGVIDWGDAALGDPALDHGRLVRDFGVPADQRSRFYAVCTALEDVAYGREPYVANAVEALGRLRR